MADAGTFQDALADFSAEVFVGRGEQLLLFERALTAPRPPFLVLAVSGQGGVGKTTLLEQFCRIAHAHDVLTALVNEDQPTVPEALARLAHQFGEAGHSLKSFDERYHKYRELKDQVEADPKAPTGILDFAVRGAAQIGLRAARKIPVAGEALADFNCAHKLDPTLAWIIACAFALQPEVTQACDWLRRAIQVSPRSLEAVLTDTDFDAIRDTPEFQALLKEFEEQGAAP